MEKTCKDCIHFDPIWIADDGFCNLTGCVKEGQTSTCQDYVDDENTKQSLTGSGVKRLIIVTIALFLTLSVVGQTRDQVAKELQRQNVPHWRIVLAQARLETGNFTSYNCRVRRNLFGIKHGGKYATYRRWQDSIADYKKCISSRYRSGENYYQFLRRIGYAEDKAYIPKVRHIASASN